MCVYTLFIFCNFMCVCVCIHHFCCCNLMCVCVFYVIFSCSLMCVCVCTLYIYFFNLMCVCVFYVIFFIVWCVRVSCVYILHSTIFRIVCGSNKIKNNFHMQNHFILNILLRCAVPEQVLNLSHTRMNIYGTTYIYIYIY